MDHSAKFLDLLNFMAILILSVAFHEAAHAWLADRFGDDTPRAHGRMTFNPFAHVHPILTIALPAYFWWITEGRGFLFMASTPVRPWQMRRPRLHGMLTALGGPAASLLLGIACFAIMVAFVVAIGGVGPETGPGQKKAILLMVLAVKLNVFGAFFNLVPLPPLDGASIVEFFLPRSLRPAWEGYRSYSWIVFAVLAFSGILGTILMPVMDATSDLVELGLGLGNWISRG
jgi:Zn-dependent protease